MSHNDIAALCLRQPGCRAFSIFTRSSDGQRDYCLSSAGGPLAADLPAEWDMADTCNGVYVLEGGYGNRIVRQGGGLPYACVGRGFARGARQSMA